MGGTDLVGGGISVGPALDRDSQSCGTGPQSYSGDAEGVHDG